MYTDTIPQITNLKDKRTIEWAPVIHYVVRKLPVIIPWIFALASIVNSYAIKESPVAPIGRAIVTSITSDPRQAISGNVKNFLGKPTVKKVVVKGKG